MLSCGRKMRSLSSVGLGLSIVFGCLLLALLAELYYLLWCKKRSTSPRPDCRNDYSTPGTREFLFIFCCSSRRDSSSSSPSPFSNPKSAEALQVQESQQCDYDGDDNDDDDDDDNGGFGNVDPGLMPRFLFTIKEETMEEMEFEEGISAKGKSLNDLFLNIESGATPYLTPLASPSLFTPPLTPLMESCSKTRKEGISNLFESSTDAEFNKLVRSSPSQSSSLSPLPRFKFLRDAEEKLNMKKKIIEKDYKFAIKF